MNRTAKLFLVLFLLVWVSITAVNLITPDRGFSENENRYLASFTKPNLQNIMNGSFMQRTNDYLSDQFVFRDGWIVSHALMEYGLGKRESGGVYVTPDALYKHLPPPNTQYVENNIAGINAFSERYEVPCYVMIVPSSAYIYSDSLPVFAPRWDEGAWIDSFYSRLTEAEGIPVTDALAGQRDGYIYYRTDHHWTTFGAYTAYERYCEALGLAYADYSAAPVTDSFNGTLYSSSGVRFVAPDSVEAFNGANIAGCTVYNGERYIAYNSPYFEQFSDKKDVYAYFLGTNELMVTVHGDGDTGKKLLVFKDSFAHCLAPMLTENYDEITLIDLRYIKEHIGELVKVEDYDAVLFLFGTEVLSSSDNTGILQSIS